ncbi:MAG: alkaline shock response membrane anchor protein AmaP [Clostridia bacterium]|nr:alkaline shock response membrane anchor protein AmaP [Clostridia bacterium]
MRFLDKFISFIFNLFVIVLAVAVLLVVVDVVNYPVIDGLLRDYVFNIDYKAIVLSTAIIVILAGLKITIFSSALSNTAQKSIMVDTVHGKIQINQDTIENVAKNVIKDYDSIKDVHTRMTKAKNGINMYMMLSVYQNTNIKDVVTRVQDNVKKQIEATTSVIVRNVDVKIKNVSGNPGDKKAKTTKNSKAEINMGVSENNIEPEQIPYIPTMEVEDQVGANDSTDVNANNYVSVQPTGEYKKDENDVLYTVEPNPNSTYNNQN